MFDFIADLTIWAVSYYILAHIVVALWYWHFCTVAKRKMRIIEGILVAILAPVYGVLPLSALALIEAWACREQSFKNAYGYYLVATIFGRARATQLYGEHHIATRVATAKLKQLFH